jgi:hypothetical protein
VGGGVDLQLCVLFSQVDSRSRHARRIDLFIGSPWGVVVVQILFYICVWICAWSMELNSELRVLALGSGCSM